MLDRRHRLTSSAGFTKATRRGRRAGTGTVVLHLWTPTLAGGCESGRPVEPVTSDSRVGFVVSKSVGNAVVRNRVKRRLRDLARHRLPSLPGSAVLVVRALPAAAAATYDALARDVDAALSRLDVAVRTEGHR